MRSIDKIKARSEMQRCPIVLRHSKSFGVEDPPIHHLIGRIAPGAL